MISVNVEIRIKNILRKEMEKSYESKRSEFEKGTDEPDKRFETFDISLLNT